MSYWNLAFWKFSVIGICGAGYQRKKLNTVRALVNTHLHIQKVNFYSPRKEPLEIGVP
jgi:hypothetical protein